MTKTGDKDLSYKLRFRRILFLQGYWSPIEVDLSEYEHLGVSLKRRSLTDLDVLGIKYDSLFTPFRVVGDCKSGKNISDSNRLFWLKGVKNYFGADQAYFIHPVIKNHTRGIAPKLGLRVLDEGALSGLENNLNPKKFFMPLADVAIHESIAGLWGINVPEGLKPTEEQLRLKQVYSYLSYSYWYIEQYRNLLNILEFFAKISSLLEAQNEAHILLAYTGLERFAHSLLETASFVLAQGGSNIPRDARSYIFGGPLALKEKENFFQLLRSLTKSNEQLDPPYLKDVIELLGRMVRNPEGACDILRHIYGTYLWCVHLKNDSLPALDGEKENTASIVLARDVTNTFFKITGMKETIFSAILSL